MDAGTGPTITVALLMAALSLKLTDFAKYVVLLVKVPFGRADGWKEAVNGIVTLLLTAFLGVIIVELLKASAWGDEITIGNEQLNDLAFGSSVLFGVVFTAAASTLYDFKKAVDEKDSAKKPQLFTTESGAQAAEKRPT